VTIITAKEMTLERLRLAFEAAGVSAAVIEYLPATQALERDVCLRASYVNGREVTIWPDMHEPIALLRLRSVALNREESSGYEHDELLDLAADANQLLDYFGALNVRSLLGVTVEYVIPWQHELLEETVVLAAERMAEGAGRARDDVADALGGSG